MPILTIDLRDSVNNTSIGSVALSVDRNRNGILQALSLLLRGLRTELSLQELLDDERIKDTITEVATGASRTLRVKVRTTPLPSIPPIRNSPLPNPDKGWQELGRLIHGADRGWLKNVNDPQSIKDAVNKIIKEIQNQEETIITIKDELARKGYSPITISVTSFTQAIRDMAAKIKEMELKVKQAEELQKSQQQTMENQEKHFKEQIEALMDDNKESKNLNSKLNERLRSFKQQQQRDKEERVYQEEETHDTLHSHAQRDDF